MKAYEFPAQIEPNGTLAIPPQILADLGSERKVIVQLWDLEDEDEERDWANLAAKQFVEGSDEENAAHDDLPGR
jgi:hypothetical protein